jgi:hypothetical protein
MLSLSSFKNIFDSHFINMLGNKKKLIKEEIVDICNLEKIIESL